MQNGEMLSVVIPCRDAAGVLGEQLDALAAQDTEAAWEVIVADNGSTDDSRRVAQSFAGRVPGLRVIDASTRPGRHHACNAGAAAARGDGLAFVDADDRVDHRYIGAMAHALAQHAVVVPRHDHRRLNQGPVRELSNQTRAIEPTPFLPFGGGSGLGVRTEVFTALGGFDETMDFCEDADLCWRGQLAGHSLYFEPAALVHVRHRSTLRTMYTQHRRYGAGSVLLYRRFHGLGMRRPTAQAAVQEWVYVIRAVPRLRDPDVRLRWARRLGRAVGRLQGSVRHRVLYL